MPGSGSWKPKILSLSDLVKWQHLRRCMDAELQKLDCFLYSEQRAGRKFCPDPKDVFNAFRLVKPDEVRCVILGQDPYLVRGQADGLAFSVSRRIHFPPSLWSLFWALKRDLGAFPPQTDLTPWATQSKVLLLNTALTVEAKKPKSHLTRWEEFTDCVVEILADKPDPLVFLLWGNSARRKAKTIRHIATGRRNPHLVLCAPHPSSLGLSQRRFRCCRHFSQTNDFLPKDKQVDWLMSASMGIPWDVRGRWCAG